MTALDDILKDSTVRRKGCWVCGEPSTAAVSVMVRRLRNARPEGESRSTQHNFCDKHAAARYVDAVALIEGAS